MLLIKFKLPWEKWTGGDVAGFEDAKANALIKAGYADLSEAPKKPARRAASPSDSKPDPTDKGGGDSNTDTTGSDGQAGSSEQGGGDNADADAGDTGSEGS